MPGRVPNPYLLVGPKPVTFSADLTTLRELPLFIERQLEKVVEKYAYMIKELAQWYVPVDQGAAKASIYVVTSRNSDKDKAYAEASQKALTEESRWNHKGRALEFAPDIEEEGRVRALHAMICVGVVYGMWLELGEYTIHAENPGATHPYLTPAVMHYEESFLKACAGVFEQVKR
jgi:hypothetical protein